MLHITLRVSHLSSPHDPWRINLLHCVFRKIGLAHVEKKTKKIKQVSWSILSYDREVGVQENNNNNSIRVFRVDRLFLFYFINRKFSSSKTENPFRIPPPSDSAYTLKSFIIYYYHTLYYLNQPRWKRSTALNNINFVEITIILCIGIFINNKIFDV